LTIDKREGIGYIRSAMKVAQVLNVTKGIVIAQEAECAFSLGQRLKGLLGRASLAANRGMIIKPCSSIHTFCMRFAIDVLFLDKDLRIIRLIKNIPPNRLSPIVWGSKMAIELPAGQASQTNTQAGDQVEFKQL
jgi:uncharacterized membrane protein (UPF0127 family)